MLIYIILYSFIYSETSLKLNLSLAESVYSPEDTNFIKNDFSIPCGSVTDRLHCSYFQQSASFNYFNNYIDKLKC